MENQAELLGSNKTSTATAVHRAISSSEARDAGITAEQATVLQQPNKTTHGTGNIDMRSLRLPQNFGEAFAVRKMVTRIPVRKPVKTEFFRVRGGEEWCFSTMIIELKQEGETYLITREVWDAVPDLMRPAMIHYAIDRKGNPFLIPVPLPGEDGRRNPWHESLAQAVIVAQNNWARISANMHIGGYDLLVAASSLAEPEWPVLSLDELMGVAFRGRIITSAEHPVIRQLLGIC